MTQRGRIGSCFITSWLVLLACGGITERNPTEDDGSSATASSTGSPSAAGSSWWTPTPTAMRGIDVACLIDTDCPDEGPSPLPPGSRCGGGVCNRNRETPSPVGNKTFACNWAGSDAAGHEGRCTTDADCKCQSLGASCVASYCTFTHPPDAP